MQADPYLPLATPKPFGEGLWLVDGPVMRMGYAGVTSIPFPTRMVVARLSDGGLWLHSPIEWSQTLAEALEGLGPIRALVAPNRLHVAFLPDWARRHPQAGVFAEPGAARELAKKGETPEGLAELGRASPWAVDIDQVLVEGPMLSEAVFFHRASRTLILTDLIENFEPGRVRGALARLMLRMTGVLAPNGRTPRDIAATFLFRRGAVRAAVETMRGWRPERISLAHGAPIERDADAALLRGFAWTGLRGGVHG